VDLPNFLLKKCECGLAANSINFGAWSSGAGIYARIAGSSDAYGYNTGSVLPADTWVHIAVVYDGTASTNADRLKIYANGTLLSLSFGGTIPATTPTVSANATLGVATGSPHYWKGSIDEVRVWNRALCQGKFKTI
jgi:Concanavalin A-like lectin/glucanases superfamily